jgi:hypothetical protein
MVETHFQYILSILVIVKRSVYFFSFSILERHSDLSQCFFELRSGEWSYVSATVYAVNTCDIDIEFNFRFVKNSCICLTIAPEKNKPFRVNDISHT